MLIDDIKTENVSKWGPYLSKFHTSQIRAGAYRARAFVFDEKASEKLGHFIRTCPDIIVDQSEFAVPPYSDTYIELDLEALHRGIGAETTIPNGSFEADWKLGLLSSPDGCVYSFANSHSHPACYSNVFGTVDLKNAQAFGKELVERNPPTPYSAVVALGSSWTHLDDERRVAFAQRWGLAYFGPQEVFSAMKRLAGAHSGEPRIYVAALLMLYQKRHLSFTAHPYERRISRGKSRLFMEHSTVTIHLEGDLEIRRAFTTGDRSTPRRHEVRTTYCHKHGDTACEHQWVQRKDSETGEELHRWDCPLCGRFRWLRKEHLRGDASKGFVTKHYEVKL